MEELLLARSQRDDQTNCLRWMGAHTQKGYGHVVQNGQTRPVHRVAYEVWLGPIPEGLEVDHVKARGCLHRDCIEPTHLEAVTHAENVLRGDAPSALNARKTQCPQGHPYDAANTWVAGDGSRKCRACKSARNQEYRARRRARTTGAATVLALVAVLTLTAAPAEARPARVEPQVNVAQCARFGKVPNYHRRRCRAVPFYDMVPPQGTGPYVTDHP